MLDSGPLEGEEAGGLALPTLRQNIIIIIIIMVIIIIITIIIIIIIIIKVNYNYHKKSPTIL